MNQESPRGKLEGKRALVTGAGRGIGRAIAVKLASEGARVLAADLDAEPLEETAALVRSVGGYCEEFAGDVTDPEYGERVIETMRARLGGIEIIVNNAGYIWNTTIQKTSDEQWYAMLDVHATAPFRILRAAQRYFKEAAAADLGTDEAPHRKVVNVSSVSGVYGAATQLAYASGKAAVIGLTKTLAREWGRYRVNVNCVAFGLIETRLTEGRAGATIEVQGRELKVGFPPELREAIPRGIALGRAGTPEDAAGAVFLLCLPESDFVTGQVLECSGGPTPGM
ncbi:MAG: SDR family oxidoreductase [Acidobacteriota bacterium]